MVQELAQQGPIPGLWAKAFSECDGNENRAKALYMKLRVGQLLALDALARAKVENELLHEQKRREIESRCKPQEISKAELKTNAMLSAGFFIFILVLLAIVFSVS